MADFPPPPENPDPRAADSTDETSEHTSVASEPDYGFPASVWQTLERRRPPGSGIGRRFRSPLRGPWLTSVFGSVLLVSLPIVIITGLLSYSAYGPQLGQALPADVGFLRLPHFQWPTRPSWLYQLTQGLHVGLGLILIPLVLAKLWSVIPKLFRWPPARSIAQVLERITLIMLVGGILFEIATGVLNIQYDYLFGFDFYSAHYYGAWVFIIGFVGHAVLKVPVMIKSLRSRSLRATLRTSRLDTVAESPDDTELVAPHPAPATLSRRGALALVGGGTLLVAILTAGQTLGGLSRHAALLLPRGRSYGSGPNDFQINRTAKAAQIDPAMTGAQWRLTVLGGPQPIRLDRAALLAMPQHTATLPIACVEGWSSTQSWTGVRLTDLAALTELSEVDSATTTSLEKSGAFTTAKLAANQVHASNALLALQVNGADLSLDHGFPARIIVPALPGVHNTKWVSSLEFTDAS